MMQIYINGEEQQLPENSRVSDVLEYLGRKPLGLAVELNREVVPRSMHAETPVKPGDRIEIVHMVGGG